MGNSCTQNYTSYTVREGIEHVALYSNPKTSVIFIIIILRSICMGCMECVEADFLWLDSIPYTFPKSACMCVCENEGFCFPLPFTVSQAMASPLYRSFAVHQEIQAFTDPNSLISFFFFISKQYFFGKPNHTL